MEVSWQAEVAWLLLHPSISHLDQYSSQPVGWVPRGEAQDLVEKWVPGTMAQTTAVLSFWLDSAQPCIEIFIPHGKPYMYGSLCESPGTTNLIKPGMFNVLVDVGRTDSLSAQMLSQQTTCVLEIIGNTLSLHAPPASAGPPVVAAQLV